MHRIKLSMNTIIGLFGMMCSGKDTVADYLSSLGYRKLSMSEDVLKPILLRLKLKPDRVNYIKLGKVLKEFKKDILAFMIHGLINKGEGHKFVIPNIMTFEEARFLKSQKDIRFLLFKVSAEQNVRYERNLQRKSEKDVVELSRFKKLDMWNLTRTGLKELMHASMEDAEIINNTSLEELHKKINELVKKYEL